MKMRIALASLVLVFSLPVHAHTNAVGSKAMNAVIIQMIYSLGGSTALEGAAGAGGKAVMASRAGSGAADAAAVEVGVAARLSAAEGAAAAKSAPATWNQFQASTRGQFATRAEAGKAWAAYKEANGIVTGSTRSMAARSEYLKSLANNPNMPSWMKPGYAKAGCHQATAWNTSNRSRLEVGTQQRT